VHFALREKKYHWLCNADETAVSLEPLPSKAVDETNAKRVVVMHRGKRRDNVTVYLHYAVEIQTGAHSLGMARSQGHASELASASSRGVSDGCPFVHFRAPHFRSGRFALSPSPLHALTHIGMSLHRSSVLTPPLYTRGPGFYWE
jgi:hypothetical protein